MAEETKQRIIQEFVPGKQVTLAHVIANPVPSLYEKMGLIDARGAIAADVATKAADVSIGFVDRFNGTLIICGDVAAVESALREVMHTLCEMMGFTPTVVTKT